MSWLWIMLMIPITVCQNVIRNNHSSQINVYGNMSNFVISTVPVDALALLYARISTGAVMTKFRARFLSLAQSKLRLCSANHRAGYFSNLACDWLSIVWAYSEQDTENGPSSMIYVKGLHLHGWCIDWFTPEQNGRRFQSFSNIFS